MFTPLLRKLKEEGYHVTVNTTDSGKKILRHNPHVDAWIIHVKDSVPNEKLGEHWDNMAKGFDKFINLSGSVEGNLLKIEGKKEFLWEHDVRHEKCNRNYYDEQFKIAGYPEVTGKNGELFFSPLEHRLAKSFAKKHRKRFKIMWSLAGSSFHKNYPYTEIVAKWLLDKYDDIIIITVGDSTSVLLEWQYPRTICRSDKWDIRKSLIMTQYVDLVVGTETGILNAAGCYDTAKVIFLSHSSEENLTKYWENTTALHVYEHVVSCYPCHQLHYSMESCPIHEKLKTPLCMVKLSGERVFKEIERQYQLWVSAKVKSG
ncbi:hypothetical protein CMI37_32200 [Candidatus Pacearchaeota archaeon]|nr:hypothetical protein [Candidatus Pacearchaeota archaeon]|tara:strand:+ start:9000 stop:9947 length:948 start_codon:yes stop_codon:yes gene_type:complete